MRLDQMLEQVTEPFRLIPDLSQAATDTRWDRRVGQGSLSEGNDACDRLPHVMADLMEAVKVWGG